jgi:hypothetical protein
MGSRGTPVVVSHGDDDFAASVPFRQVPNCLRSLDQWVGLAHTGVTVPASINSASAWRSSHLTFDVTGRSLLPVNRDRIGARRICRKKPPVQLPPPSPPTIANVPPLVSAPLSTEEAEAKGWSGGEGEAFRPFIAAERAILDFDHFALLLLADMKTGIVHTP